jgi:nucleoside-diphosphate-sugar epimerase
VVHLAARVHIMRDAAPAEHRRVNTEATLRLAQSAAGRGVTRFLFMSTVKVNGERGTFSERDAPAPVEPYAVSKWEAERGLARIAPLELVCLRPPLVYGPGVKGNFLRLMRLVERGLPLPLGSVRNARSMIYVGNLASAVVRSLAGPTGTFLVSDDADMSTPELVRKIAVAMGRQARLVPFPPRLLHALGALLGKGEEVSRMLESLRVDCSGFKQQFQWVAPFSVEQGLKDTADWYARERSTA